MKTAAQSRWRFICIIISLLIIFAKTAHSSEKIAEVRIACEKDFDPYCFMDANGGASGFGADLIRAVAKAMDMPVAVYPQTWDAAWNGLVDGRFDALPVVAKLPSRVPLVDFSLAHTETYDSFFVRSTDPVIKGISSARGKEIIVMRSDAAHHALLERGFEGRIIPVDTIAEMLSLLASGRHDAILYPKLLGILKIKELDIRGLKAGPTIPDYKREFSFAVRKGNPELLEKLNQGLLMVKSNGEYQRIYEKWLSYEDPWQRYSRYFWPAIAVAAAAVAAAAIIIIILQRLVRQRTAELAEKNAMLKLAQEDLNEKVRHRTAELHEANEALIKENAERRHAEDALIEVHAELENRIVERTAELQEANLRLLHEFEERKKVEADLIKIQKLKSLGIFAGGIAHDFNNLLQAFIVNISVAKMYAKESALLDVLKDAETAAKYASRLSNRLLTFAKGGNPVKKVTSIQRIVEESKGLALCGTNIVCESSMPDELYEVEVDEGQICQVLTNLFINAKEAMPDGGKIKIMAANLNIAENEQPFLKQGEYVRISVEDTGFGIPGENLEKIFDPYFSTKHRGPEKGTGLGLSICHSIMIKHGGLITVESNPGTGSTFHLFLPACHELQNANEIAKVKLNCISGRILFMEDEKSMWEAMRFLLNTIGYEVEFSTHGDEAASIYRKGLMSGNPFDGVILDLTIPGGLGGKETIKLLKRMDENVKAIVVSGYSEDPVLMNYKEFGFANALAKPYTMEQLKEAVLGAFPEKDPI